ncbi:MAG: DUF4381 domain-containing protein [Gammaproteobacteria bacterium HGW-Gammaproteobacteria-3]|jgi:glutamate/tyrosine decarboxylase-like PLP-dependent enzyme|nr:MAG: DUF4381 domain-containing protein [Gammaproteobacteria bacterium HGW-Gammaproteobacteria-3]
MKSPPLPLRPIHLPEAIGWWPPAPGWWLLLALAALLLWLGFKGYRRITRNTALKSARKLLAEIKQDPTQDDSDKIAQLSVLLRRVAISLAPRSEAASLTGMAWLRYLDGSMQNLPFSQGIGRMLIDAPYRPKHEVQADLPTLLDLCENWLKTQAKRTR